LRVVLRLITLGGLALTKDGAPYAGVAAQRRRLAMLAVLATAGAAGVSRDKLLAYFWPETDDDQARHALNQALHQIRAALGPDAVMSTSTALALDPAGITSDVAEFERASAERQYERAAALYQGPFLDGFHIRDAIEFERWVTVTRAALAHTWTSVVESLAVAASGRRDRGAVVRWRGLLATADPLNARVIVALAEAHVAAGDRAAALRAMTAHAALVRTELEAEPDPGVTDWIARLRRAPQVDAGPAGPITHREHAPRRDRDHVDRDRVERATGGRYTIDGVLARGAVLTSFSATDARDRAPVALHIVAAHAAAQADPDRFIDTLRRVGTVGDPRVVPVLDAAVTDDGFWFVTPIPPSPTLRDRLARERQLAIPDVIRLARDLATTLTAAHAHDVTHGDLRPKHIAVLPDGVVVSGWALIDALAIIRDPDAGRAETAVSISAPAYASPEQLEGNVLPDARSDIYSVGCVLFEALAGAPPFMSGGAHALVSHKLTRHAPSVLEARDSVPAALDAALRTCLARVPADRFPSGAALAAALESVPG
jgi:DNA-binding SARP family transcriptional activator